MIAIYLRSCHLFLKQKIVDMLQQKPQWNIVEHEKQAHVIISGGSLTEVDDIPVIALVETAEEAVNAFIRGALDCLNTSSFSAESLHRLITLAASVPKRRKRDMIPPEWFEGKQYKQTELFLVLSSTGGIQTLHQLLSHIPSYFPIPLFVAQQTHENWLPTLVQRFQETCALRVKIAEEEEQLKPGTVYIAPVDKQMILTQHPDGTYRSKVQGGVFRFSPSFDVLLRSAAQSCQERVAVLVLSAPAYDGVAGCCLVKRYGGHLFVESDETTWVPGLAKAVYEAHYADYKIPGHELLKAIHYFLK